MSAEKKWSATIAPPPATPTFLPGGAGGAPAATGAGAFPAWMGYAVLPAYEAEPARALGSYLLRVWGLRV